MRLNKVILITAAIALSLSLLYISIDRMALFFLAKKHNLDIAYKNIKRVPVGEWILSDLDIVYKKERTGIFAKDARIRVTLSRIFPPSLTIDFHFYGVNFTKRGSEETTSLDSLLALVDAPFNSNWIYREIRGRIEPLRDGLKIAELSAISDEIQLSFMGTVYYKAGKLDADAVIRFSDRLTASIPQELSEALLVAGGDGWNSLSVKLSGDYRTPSIQVSGKLFRLNIKTVSGV